jgi:cysteine desulfurase
MDEIAHICLDHSANTPVHPEFIEAMLPFFRESYKNPSIIHKAGQKARYQGTLFLN